MTSPERSIVWTILLATVVPWLIIVYVILPLVTRHTKPSQNLRRIQVLVLGDIGRSPRMQYHALSLAKRGMLVELIGYRDSPLHPEIALSTNIRVMSIPPPPKVLQPKAKRFFVVFGPLKVLFQSYQLVILLLFKTKHSGWLLVQNPPSIPTLAVAQLACLFRHTRLVIDWHNFGYSILALKLGDHHLLVRLSKLYENSISRYAYAHFCVTNAMAKKLLEESHIAAPVVTVHDRPAMIFKPLDSRSRMEFLDRFTAIAGLDHSLMQSIKSRRARLVVSATSWTPDEDFSILLEALKGYAHSKGDQKAAAPNILVIVTGKGPMKVDFESKVDDLEKHDLLRSVTVKTFFFDDVRDYASLLGSSDLGISLHTSSSGVDLPMKVVDMFGAGLPVAGWDHYEAWPELVTQDFNGLGFRNVQGLKQIFRDVFIKDPAALERLRKGATTEGSRRWEDEWSATAGKLLVVS